MAVPHPATERGQADHGAPSLPGIGCLHAVRVLGVGPTRLYAPLHCYAELQEASGKRCVENGCWKQQHCSTLLPPLMPPMLAGSGFKLPALGAAHHSLLVGAGSTGRGVPA